MLEKYLAPGEDWKKLCDRVSGVMRYRAGRDAVYEDLVNKRWLPNSPALVNASKAGGRNMMACHALHVPDSIEGIMDTAKQAAMIFKSGGGLGIELSALTPAGAALRYAPLGKASGPVSFLDIFNSVAKAVAQGGLRRAAILASLNVSHPDILEFVHCKEVDKTLSNFNMTVTMDEGPNGVREEVWDDIVNHAWNNGEPGVAFLDTINASNPTLDDFGRIIALNACVVGDTLVAVADGRDVVSIRELAEEGKDVPLYCQGPEGIVIRMGRHPRKTRANVPVLKVTLDDGSSIKTTPDHRFMKRDRIYCEAKDLKIGDSLMPFYKYQFDNNEMYWAINLNRGNELPLSRLEHRMIAEFNLVEKLKPGLVIHHRNGDGLDNRYENLAIMAASEHNRLHMLGDNNPMRDKWWNKLSEEEKRAYRDKISDVTSGENNGMYGRKHSEETKRKIGRLAKKRMTPENREQISESLKRWYQEHGTEHLKGHRVARIETACSHCGKKLVMTQALFKRRTGINKHSRVFCSSSCINLWRSENAIQVKYSDEQIAGWGQMYVEDTGRLPTASGWDVWRNGNKAICSREVVRSRLGSFLEFREMLSMHNHKVVTVEPCGTEDVYNITVDEYHNLVYITNVDGRTRTNHLRVTGVVMANCAELPLYDGGSCVLASIALPNVIKKIGDWMYLRRAVRNAVKFLDQVIDVNYYPIPFVAATTRRERAIGVGVMGFSTLLEREGIPYTSKEALILAELIGSLIKLYAIKVSEELAEQYGGYLPGRRRNARLTAIAPTGHISQIAGVSYSIYPELQEALRMTPQEHLDMVWAWQKNVDSSISYTVNIEHDTEPQLVDRIFRTAYDMGLKVISVYRDGSRADQPCKIDGECSI